MVVEFIESSEVMISFAARRFMYALERAFSDYGNLCTLPDRLMRERLSNLNGVNPRHMRELRGLHELDEQSVATHGSGYFLIALAQRFVADREYKPELPSQKLLQQSLHTAHQ